MKPVKLKILAFALALTLATNLSAQTQIDRLTYATDWGKGETNSAFADFDSWANQFATTSNLTIKAEIVSDGVALAKERRRAFTELIKTDPEKALALTVSASVRQRLPADVVNELETRVSAIGDYTVIAGLPVKDGPPVEPIQRFVNLNGQSYRAYVYGRRLGETCKDGIPLHGVVLDGVMAVHESALRELESDETPDATKQVIDLRTAIQQSVGASTPTLAEIGGTIYSFASPEQMQQAETRLETAEAEIGPEPIQAATNVINKIEQSGTGIKPLNVPTPWTTGLKKVLIIRIDFSDLPGDPNGYPPTYDPTSNTWTNTIFTSSYVQNIADTQIALFYAQSSYGLTSLTNTVTTQVYRMPQTAAYYASSPGPSSQLLTDAETAASTNYSVSSYDRIIVLFSSFGNVPGADTSYQQYSGWAQLGNSGVWLNGYFAYTATHELGHTYGLNHAGLWLINDGNPISNAGANITYGDPFDPMGSPYDLRADFNPYFKNILGWISDAQVRAVTMNGIYRVFAFDSDNYSAPTNETLALKIVKDGNRTYWIGCRRNFTDNSSMQNGAYIIWGYNTPTPVGGDLSDLLDMTTPGNNSQDSALAIGATFNDPDANITIEPVAEGGTAPNEYIDVQVTVNTSNNIVAVTPLTVTTLAGLAGVSGNANGTGTNALFNYPEGIAVDSADNVYVADSENNIVREISSAGLVSTVADGFNFPRGIAVDGASNIYVADYSSSTIRKVASGTVSIIAGRPYYAGSVDGMGSSAQFDYPSGIAIDKMTNIYVTDIGSSTVRKIAPIGTNWMVTTLAGFVGYYGSTDGIGTNAQFFNPAGITVDNAGNVYVADTANCTIRKITSSGVVTTIAGIPRHSGSADGVGTNAQFGLPSGITIDSKGNLFVIDGGFASGNNTVREITPVGTNWVTTTVAGQSGSSGSADGTGSQARFNYPYAISIDANDAIYIADSDNDTIRVAKSLLPVIPTLHAKLSGNQAVLTWPTSAGNYSLESSTNLQNWITASINPLIINGQAFVTNSTLGQTMFFRLKKQ